MEQFSGRFYQWVMVREVREFLEDQYPSFDIEATQVAELAPWLVERLLIPKNTSPWRFAAQLRAYFKGNMLYSTVISKTPASQ